MGDVFDNRFRMRAELEKTEANLRATGHANMAEVVRDEMRKMEEERPLPALPWTCCVGYSRDVHPLQGCPVMPDPATPETRAQLMDDLRAHRRMVYRREADHSITRLDPKTAAYDA